MTATPKFPWRSFVATALASATCLIGLAVGADALRVTPATYSGTNGALLYYKTSGFGMNATSTFTASALDGAPLTPNFIAAGQGMPEISADGTKAVWAETSSSAWSIKMINTDGTNPVTVVSGTGSPSATHPSFSPDGTKIVVSYDKDIHIINAAASQTFSGSTTVVDSSGGMNMALQPQYISSTKIAYLGTQAGACSAYNAIYVKDLGVSGIGTLLTNSCDNLNNKYATNFDVSPNGQFVLFRYGQNALFSVQIIKVDNSGSPIVVYTGTSNSNDASGQPRFAPDGTKIAFNADSKLKVASFDGTTVGTASDVPFPTLVTPPDTFTWASVESNAAASPTTTTTSTTTTTTTTTTVAPTTTAAPATTVAATTTTVANVYAAAKPGITVTDTKVYTAPPTQVAASSAIIVLSAAQNKVMDIQTKTPAVCLPNDDDLVFIDEGKCIAEVVNAKTRAVLRTLKTTVVADDISEVKVGNEIVTLAPIYFDVMSSKLDAKAMGRLRSLKARISAAGSVLLIGHSGTLNGNSPANVAVSKARAESTLAALKSVGAQGPFAISGVGALDPASKGKTEAAQAKNRRVVIVLIP